MIPHFTMRQALSQPDLLGSALVTRHCQRGGDCSGSSQGTAYDVRLVGASSWPAHETDDAGLHRIFNKH
jgi:hypothetical protein